MNLYNFDPNTKEYLMTTIASADPMETKIKGEFIPLVPAYATLVEPPETGEGEVAIFNGESWEIKKDFRVSHKICDENFNIKNITEIGEIKEKYLVTNEIAELIKENPNNFKIQNNEIVQKTESEIEQEKAQEEAERIAMLNLTAADVERAIYRAKGLDFDDVITLIQAQPLTETGEPLIDIKALKIELKANNFYRGNPYINQVGAILGFSSKQLDDFFETNDYTKLLSE